MKFEEKYAPQSLEEVVFPSAAIQNQVMAIAAKQSDDDLLLHGPHGTGKSTVARLIYKQWYGYFPNWEVAFSGPQMSTESSAAGYLTTIGNLGPVSKFCSGYGMVIIDELDVVAKNAQYRLREIMQAKLSRPQFVFTTNQPNKVYTGIRSACRSLEFPNPAPLQWLPRANQILQAEGVFLSDGAVLRLLSAGTGDIRSTCRMLQDVVLAHVPSMQPNVPTLGAGQPTAPHALPAVSLIQPSAPLGQPTP
jgi:replication factor C subunit 3/5